MSLYTDATDANHVPEPFTPDTTYPFPKRFTREDVQEFLGFDYQTLKVAQNTMKILVQNNRVTGVTHHAFPTLLQQLWQYPTYEPFQQRYEQYTNGGREWVLIGTHRSINWIAVQCIDNFRRNKEKIEYPKTPAPAASPAVRVEIGGDNAGSASTVRVVGGRVEKTGSKRSYEGEERGRRGSKVPRGVAPSVAGVNAGSGPSVAGGKPVRFLYVDPAVMNMGETIYSWTDARLQTGLATFKPPYTLQGLIDLALVSRGHHNVQRTVRNLYGCIRDLVSSLQEPDVLEIVRLDDDDSVRTLITVTANIPVITIQVILYRLPEAGLPDSPCPGGHSHLRRRQPPSPRPEQYEDDVGQSTDDDSQFVPGKRMTARVPKGFCKVAEFVGGKLQKWQRKLDVARNSAHRNGSFNSVVFPGEAPWDRNLAMPMHVHQREKAVWIAEGSSNGNYREYRRQTPLTEEEVAEDQAANYVWEYDFDKRRTPTPPPPDATDCKSRPFQLLIQSNKC
jgi:hypothetical protein